MRIEKTIDIECANCGKTFQKIAREHRRQIKNGKTRFFCGLSCTCHKRNEEHPRPGLIDNLVSDNRRDKLTPFRWFILRAEYRDRTKNYGCDITTEYLKQLWEQQKGICPFTGWNLNLPEDTGRCFIEQSTANASLDRIDNSIGYVQGNVRFISVMANLARNKFSDEQLIEFCEAVAAKTHTSSYPAAAAAR